MLREKYTIIGPTTCHTCDAFDECFQWYDLDENGQPVITLTQCGMCDMDTDPRGAECIEDLRNPEMWRS